MSPNYVKYVTNFVKIGQLIQYIKGKEEHHMVIF
jgi:hypothetical protein